MKTNFSKLSLWFLAFAGVIAALVGGVGGYLSASLPDPSTKPTAKAVSVIDVKSDTITKEEEHIAKTLQVSHLKTNHDEVTDLPEHLAVEQSEIFKVVRTDLVLRIINEKAIGALSFDMVYAQNKTDAEIIDLIKKNIFFIGSGKSCEVDALPIAKENREGVISAKKDTISFEVLIHCPENITSASVGNSIFSGENLKAGHFIALTSQNRTNIQSLAAGLITDKISTLEWNTKKSFEDKDSDADGLKDEEEKIYGTNPEINDSDADGDSDYKEIERGTHPLKPHDQ